MFGMPNHLELVSVQKVSTLMPGWVFCLNKLIGCFLLPSPMPKSPVPYALGSHLPHAATRPCESGPRPPPARQQSIRLSLLTNKTRPGLKSSLSLISSPTYIYPVLLKIAYGLCRQFSETFASFFNFSSSTMSKRHLYRDILPFGKLFILENREARAPGFNIILISEAFEMPWVPSGNVYTTSSVFQQQLRPKVEFIRIVKHTGFLIHSKDSTRFALSFS